MKWLLVWYLLKINLTFRHHKLPGQKRRVTLFRQWVFAHCDAALPLMVSVENVGKLLKRIKDNADLIIVSAGIPIRAASVSDRKRSLTVAALSRRKDD